MGPSGRASVSPRLTLIALALASAVAGWSCERGEATPAGRPRSAADAVRQVRLGQTTPSAIEQRFGAADQHAPDGALVYRFETTRRHGAEMRTEVETVTFHFASGTLSKVCRTRS
jgi:hypothetical protein